LLSIHDEPSLHNNAFDHIYEGEELANALEAHAGMGYNFVISGIHVAASLETAEKVDIDAVVTQIGVAPFYYDLSLVLSCPHMLPQAQEGVHTIIDEGDSQVFSFLGVPATADCLRSVTLSLDSPYAYTGRPIKIAQGPDGIVQIKLPLRWKSRLGPLFVVFIAIVFLSVVVSILCACIRHRKDTRARKPKQVKQASVPKEDKSVGATVYSTLFPPYEPRYFATTE
jgi:hypothetical protein